MVFSNEPPARRGMAPTWVAPTPAANWLLRRLPAAELRQIGPSLQPCVLDRRRFRLAAGQHLGHVYFPQSGLLSLRVPSENGQSVEVANVGCEGVLGVAVALEDDAPPYDVACVISGQALRMSADDFHTWSYHLGAFRRLMLRYAAALLSQVARGAACNRLHSVEQRLARWLLLCADRVGLGPFTVTHEDLAATLGARRPFVSQTLGGFERAGLVRCGRGRIQILDRRGLEARACEDYSITRSETQRLLAGAPG